MKILKFCIAGIIAGSSFLFLACGKVSSESDTLGRRNYKRSQPSDCKDFEPRVCKAEMRDAQSCKIDIGGKVIEAVGPNPCLAQSSIKSKICGGELASKADFSKISCKAVDMSIPYQR